MINNRHRGSRYATPRHRLFNDVDRHVAGAERAAAPPHEGKNRKAQRDDSSECKCNQSGPIPRCRHVARLRPSFDRERRGVGDSSCHHRVGGHRGRRGGADGSCQLTWPVRRSLTLDRGNRGAASCDRFGPCRGNRRGVCYLLGRLRLDRRGNCRIHGRRYWKLKHGSRGRVSGGGWQHDHRLLGCGRAILCHSWDGTKRQHRGNRDGGAASKMGCVSHSVQKTAPALSTFQRTAVQEHPKFIYNSDLPHFEQV